MLYGYGGVCRKCGRDIPEEEELCARCRRDNLMDRVLLCPFCGRSDLAEVVHTEKDAHGLFFMHCDMERGGCGAQGPHVDSEELAVESWNYRYEED